MNHIPTIEEVAPDLFRLLRDVAPERGEELERQLETVRPAVIIDTEETRHSFTANPENRTIRVGIPCLKRQLAMAYAYVIFYRSMVAYAERTGERQFPLDATERVDQATSLLRGQ